MSLENSLEVSDSDKFVMKTPVSLLQETLGRQGKTPNYQLVKIEGASHTPIFFYLVSITDKDIPFMAMGVGRSKQQAKHAAAKSLMDKLKGIQDPDSQTNVDPPPAISLFDNPMDNNISTSGGGDVDNIFGNPIGWLQEMCMSRRWPLPTYESEVEVKLLHESPFTVTCSIFNYREVGQGLSKKIAKRIAAHKMWTRLKEIQSKEMDNEQRIEILNYEFNNIRIEQKSTAHQCQCAVQLLVLPICICNGCGQTALEERKKATENASD